MHSPVTIALCLIHWCFWDPFHKFLFQKTPYHIMPLHISAGNWWYDKSFADIQCMSYTPFNRAKYKFSNSKPLVLRLYTIWVEGWRGWRGWCGHWSRWRCSAPSCVWSLYSCPTERSSPATARTAHWAVPAPPPPRPACRGCCLLFLAPPPFPPPSQGTVPHSLTHFFTLQYWIYTHLFNLFPAQDWGRVPPLAAAPTSGLEGFERQAGGEVLLSVSAQTSCSIVLSWTTAVHQQERSQAAAAGRAAASRSSRLQLPAASAAVRWVPGRGSSSSGPPLAYSDTLAQPGLALPAAATTTTTTPRPHTATSSSDEGSPGVLESPAWRAEGIWGLPGKSLVPSSSSDAAVSAVAVGAGRPGRTAAHRSADGLGFLGSWSPGGSKTGSYWSLISSDIVGGVPV